MSLQFTNRKLYMSWVKTTLITGLMTVSGGHVYASPLSTETNPAQNNWQQLIQVVSQNSSQPPDVIIDSDPNNSGNRPSGRNSSTTTTTTTSSDTRFTCDYVNGEYTVMYNPESRGSSSYPWAIPSQLGGNWTPERRCNEITNRLESYRDDGLLEMSTGVENGYDTVCVTTQIDPTDCRIVLTVPPGQDPQITRDLVFENLLIADDGQQTQGVYTYGDDNSGQDILGEIGNIIGGDKPGNSSSPDKINLRPFLDPADGGTGAKLKNNAVSPSGSTDSSNDERKPAIFE